MRSRFFRTARLSRLLERLAEQPGARALDEALAEALDDPTLTVAYWLPEERRHVGSDGRAIELPPEGGDGRDRDQAPRRARRRADPRPPRCATSPTSCPRSRGAAALALENGRLEAELRARLEALRASRARIVTAGDEERRRLGRDLHDGAQQRLISILLGLQLAHERPELSGELVARALDDARAAVEELRELAAGIHPAVLSQRGLDAGLESLATRASVPVELETELDERMPAPVESAAYFTVAEALTNVAKYAQASHARVGAHREDGELVVEVRDDGIGGADATRGSACAAWRTAWARSAAASRSRARPAAARVLRARIPVARLQARRNVEHGEHAAVVLRRLADAELGEDARDVLLDGVRGDHQRLGDAAVRAPLGHQLEHLALARRELLERVVAAAAAEHPGDHGRIERRPALRRPAGPRRRSWRSRRRGP